MNRGYLTPVEKETCTTVWTTASSNRCWENPPLH